MLTSVYPEMSRDKEEKQEIAAVMSAIEWY